MYPNPEMYLDFVDNINEVFSQEIYLNVALILETFIAKNFNLNLVYNTELLR